MKRPSNLIAKLTAGAAAAFCAGLIVNFLFVQSATTAAGRIPFTARVLQVFHNPDGAAGVRENVVIAYRSDGSQAVGRVRTMEGVAGRSPESAEFRRVRDVQAKMDHTIFPIAESVSSLPMSAGELARLTARPQDCAVEGWEIDEEPAPSTVLGHRVIKRTLTVPPSGGAAAGTIHEEWVAPELNCFPLRKITRTPGPDGIVRTRYDALEIQIGEPDEELFRVPESYTERSPREIQQEIARRRGEEFETNPAVESRTEQYYQRRAAAQ